jgi:hypothetical protein
MQISRYHNGNLFRALKVASFCYHTVLFASVILRDASRENGDRIHVVKHEPTQPRALIILDKVVRDLEIILFKSHKLPNHE